MAYISDYEIAKRHAEQRQRKRRQFNFFLAAFGIVLCFGVNFLGTIIPTCMLVLMSVVGLAVVAHAIELQLTAPQRQLSTALVEQELEWLFGQDWQNCTSSVEYAFARDRVLKRQGARAIFPFHALIFAIFYSAFVSWLSGIFAFAPAIEPKWLIFLPLVWLFFLGRHAWNSFATRGMLQRRERAVAQAVERKLQSIQSHKIIEPDTLKPGAHFVISDDGELVEVTEDQSAAKRKTQ